MPQLVIVMYVVLAAAGIAFILLFIDDLWFRELQDRDKQQLMIAGWVGVALSLIIVLLT